MINFWQTEYGWVWGSGEDGGTLHGPFVTYDEAVEDFDVVSPAVALSTITQTSGDAEPDSVAA